MSLCQHCRAVLADDLTQCEDAKACAKRVAKLLQSRFASMATKPFVGFDPDAAYRDAPKGTGKAA